MDKYKDIIINERNFGYAVLYYSLKYVKNVWPNKLQQNALESCNEDAIQIIQQITKFDQTIEELVSLM